MLAVGVVLLAAVGPFLLRPDDREETSGSGEGGADPALVTLRKRYAAGDLSDEKSERRWSRLETVGIAAGVLPIGTVQIEDPAPPTPDEMYIADETWPDLGDHLSDASLALVPLGSTEQHGPHLPLATDHLIAEAFARAAADRTGYLCTPTISIGVSSHHKQFHGTMWVDAPAFRDYVESFTRNLAYHGIDRVIYVNAHGGNVEHLREVGRRLRDDEVLYAIEWMWNESIRDLVDDLFEQNGPHGGPKETAMIQHLRPELVHNDRLEDARDGGIRDVDAADTRRHGSRTFYDAADNSGNGVFGDQTDATGEKGERMFKAATDQLVQLCDWLNARNFQDLMPEPHV